MSLPGERFHSLAERYLDPGTVQALIGPTVADLQYEVQRADSSGWHRCLAYLRGYGAIVRVLLGPYLLRGVFMRRFFVIVVMGAIGAALLIWTESTFRTEQWKLSPFGIMAIMTPVVLRFSGLDREYRKMFVNVLGVGLLMMLTFYGWFLISRSHATTGFFGYLWRLTALVGCVAVVSAMLANVPSKAPSAGDHEPSYRRMFRCLAAGYLAYVLASVLMPIVWGHRPAMMRFLDGTLLVAVLFTIVAGVVHLPILSLARTRLRNGRLLALLGAALFPAPMAGLVIVAGGQALANFWFVSPSNLLFAALPHVIAGAVLGWQLV